MHHAAMFNIWLVIKMILIQRFSKLMCSLAQLDIKTTSFVYYQIMFLNVI